MKDFVKRMIDEHKELCVRIDKLNAFLLGNGSKEIDREEYCNMRLQFKVMTDYADILEVRLANNGICFENGVYFEAIDKIAPAEQKEEK